MTLLDLFNANVTIERDVSYVPGSGDPRHRLDVYSLPNAAKRPVVVYFHGGGWRSGDKRLFEHVGRALVMRGIMTVTVDYRLSPVVRHPRHVEDCAAAIAWVHRNIASRGGDPDALFLFGHSAGAHLASLLALDRRYLRQLAIADRTVRGVVAVSGAFDLTNQTETTTYTTREQIQDAFGTTVNDLEVASPINYVRKGAPPFLIAVAEGDSPGLQVQGRRFAQLIRAAGSDVVFLSVKGRDHLSIVRRFGPADDTTASAVTEFVNHFSARGIPQ